MKARDAILVGLTVLFSAGVFAQGFDEHYAVYQGDFNSDGKIDLYVKQKPQVVILHGPIATPILIPPDVTDFVLQQNADKTFAIVSNLTSAQKATLSGWPESVIELVLNDVNIDGIVDIILRDIEVEIVGAFDQIVFADTVNANAPPMKILSMNDDFQQFYFETNEWVLNTSYFEDNAPTIFATTTHPYAITSALYGSNGALEFLYDCAVEFDDCIVQYLNPATWLPQNAGISCFQLTAQWFYQGLTNTQTLQETFSVFCNPLAYFYVVYVNDPTMVKDYSVYNTNALIIANALSAFRGTGEIDSLNPDAQIIRDIFANILGLGLIHFYGECPADIDIEICDAWWYIKIFVQISSIMLSVCERNTDDSTNCPALFLHPNLFSGVCQAVTRDITPSQDILADQLNRRGFWLSRHSDSCDPVAPIALAIVDNVGVGQIAIEWLNKVAENEGAAIDINQIGVDLMNAHKEETRSDFTNILHLLSTSQVSDYHHGVLEIHHLPKHAFGGTPFGDYSKFGDIVENLTGRFFWCTGCDPIP